MVGASTRAVGMAAVVLEHGVSALVALVDAGELAVSAAADVARLPVEDQEDLAAAGADAVRTRAITARRSGPWLGRGCVVWGGGGRVKMDQLIYFLTSRRPAC